MTKDIFISNGFDVIVSQKTFDVFEAAEHLLSRRRKRLAGISRQGERVTLSFSFLRCPWCGKTVPAEQGEGVICRSSILALTGIQQSLFEAPELAASPQNMSGELSCPRCGSKSKLADGGYALSVKAYGGVITVSRRLKTIDDILGISWADISDVPLDMSACEQVCFDTARAEITLCIVSGGVTVCRKKNFKQKDTPLADIINKSRQLKRALKNAFLCVWGRPLPYTVQELGFDRFCLMTRFVGFDRDFYESLPCRLGSKMLDDSFLPAAINVRNEKSAVKCLADSHLSRTKSVRRHFYNNPALLLYISECERLADVVGNVDYFCRLLSDDSIFAILSAVHTYPGVIEMYRDYVRVCGAKSLIYWLTSYRIAFNKYAMRYHAMSEAAREKEPMRWKDSDCFFERRPSVGYSVLMHRPPDNVPDSVIDGHLFRWLKNSDDYARASAALSNCLCEWSDCDNPVCVIERKNSILAAIEVCPDTNTVVQARTELNGDISKNKKLNSVFCRWVAQNSLIFEKNV